MTRSWLRIVAWHIVDKVAAHGDVLRVTRLCNGKDVRTVTQAQLVATELPDGPTCETCYRVAGVRGR